MAVHHGGKVGKAGETLATKGSSKSAVRARRKQPIWDQLK